MKIIPITIAAFLGTVRSEAKGTYCYANSDCTLNISFQKCCAIWTDNSAYADLNAKSSCQSDFSATPNLAIIDAGELAVKGGAPAAYKCMPASMLDYLVPCPEDNSDLEC